MKRALCAAFCLLFLVSCGKTPPKASKTLFAMDTVMELTAYGEAATEAADAAARELDRLDALLSCERQGSGIYEINHSAGAVTLSAPEVGALLREALALCSDTGGALDITVYPAMAAWGFPSKEYRVPTEAELDEVRRRVDHSAVKLTEEGGQLRAEVPAGVMLDLGAVGKGYAGDRILALWKDMGVTSGLLNLGGNVQCLGAKPDGTDWTVAVRDPADENGYLAVVSGTDMAVVTSGAYQRNFTMDGVLYHHILDPKTCRPARGGLQSATIVGPSGLVCDGLSTAVFVMGLEDAAAFWRSRMDFDMILYTDEGGLFITAGLEGRVTPAEGRSLQVIHE